jgi:hypothetical protein
MKLKMLSLALAAVFMFVAVLAPMGVQAAPAKTPVAIPASGTGTTAAGVPVNFAGTANITNFVRQGNQVLAVGTLSGTITDAKGTVTKFTDVPFNAPAPVNTAASAAQSSCTILNLVLGPLDLNLLGLMVHLNQVVLNLTAVPGAGLLGDLLCAVDNLLSGLGNLGALTQLLNNVLNILRGL